MALKQNPVKQLQKYFVIKTLDHLEPFPNSQLDNFLVNLEDYREHHTQQTHHVNSTLKRRGNGRFHVFSTWNPRGVFVG